MAGHLSARRSLRACTLLVVALLTAFGYHRVTAHAQVPHKLPMLSSVSALPQDEIADLAKVAEWLGQSPETRVPAAKLVEEIRKDRESFAVFAGFHTEQERRQALEKTPYGSEIAAAASEHHVDSLLVASVVEVESTFQPTAGSHKGAVGLMQLLPSTAGMSRARLQNPRVNLDAGAAYLASLITRFDGDLGLALAAYNAGPRNVRNYEGVPPFPETQQYVQKVLTRYVDYHRELWKSSGAAQLVASAVSMS
ncbi:MAG TPA: lytic transglycosylase domain-containing protein [Thermoanaerobaculia bacterium]|jgi:soluble lytic murein transglycosylase-like protein|nr:lytic transglycosylase domain-containing protein [Thermoanaerobaculia bacterium]